VRNHRNILGILDDAAEADWCTADLRLRLRRRYASTAYLLGRRLGDLGQPASAARWMARSIARNPLQPKAYCRMVSYFLTGLFRRQNDRGRAEA
jgi:hypothetical protein